MTRENDYDRRMVFLLHLQNGETEELILGRDGNVDDIQVNPADIFMLQTKTTKATHFLRQNFENLPIARWSQMFYYGDFARTIFMNLIS